MPAYLVADLTIQDAKAFGAYVEVAGPLIEKFGGRVVARSDAAIALEGVPPNHFVIVRFDTMDAAKRFYHSDEYRAPLQQRLGGIASGRVFLVDGA
ncbi:MAG TPA: DUF1330 domain-containing protein [Stellaceae bacterium]|jgi:uncharacterized protein (DUF1330 family)